MIISSVQVFTPSSLPPTISQVPPDYSVHALRCCFFLAPRWWHDLLRPETSPSAPICVCFFHPLTYHSVVPRSLRPLFASLLSFHPLTLLQSPRSRASPSLALLPSYTSTCIAQQSKASPSLALLPSYTSTCIAQRSSTSPFSSPSSPPHACLMSSPPPTSRNPLQLSPSFLVCPASFGPPEKKKWVRSSSLYPLPFQTPLSHSLS